jgi:hypothetical protein
MDIDEYAQVLEEVRHVLSDVVERDWSVQTGTLDWTCCHTVDHMVDCLFSYAIRFLAAVSSSAPESR